MAFLGCTWAMISSSASLITSARQMATRVGDMVQDIDEKDRRRLLRVQRRIECLIQPLNFCVMVSQRRGPSHCDPVIESVSNLIQKVCDYLRQTPENQRNLSQKAISSIGGAMAGEESDFSKQLDQFLEELDFAAISLNMVISTAPYMSTNTTSQPTSNSHSGWGLGGARREFTMDQSPCSPRDVVPDGTQGVFCPTALLRASRRIRQLDAAGEGIPVGTCLGKLYTKETDDAPYELVMQKAVFSIVRGSKGDNPLSQSRQSMSSGNSSNEGRQFSIRVEQGSDTPYEFPISTALGIGLRNVNSIFGSDSKNKNAPKDGEALVWTSNNCEQFDVPVEEMIDDVIVLSTPEQPEQQEEERDFDITSFVFVFDGDSRSLRRPSYDGAGWGPTDVLYLSRLCVLENGCHAVDGTEFAHSSATDEVLWTLFRGI